MIGKLFEIILTRLPLQHALRGGSIDQKRSILLWVCCCASSDYLTSAVYPFSRGTHSAPFGDSAAMSRAWCRALLLLACWTFGSAVTDLGAAERGGRVSIVDTVHVIFANHLDVGELHRRSGPEAAAARRGQGRLPDPALPPLPPQVLAASSLSLGWTTTSSTPTSTSTTPRRSRSRRSCGTGAAPSGWSTSPTAGSQTSTWTAPRT